VSDYEASRQAAERNIRRILEMSRRMGFIIISPDLVSIGDEVEIGEGSVIHPFSNMAGATRIGRNCVIGPFADIRDSVIGDRSVIEQAQVKRSMIGEGCKAKHHSFIGDAAIGDNVNWGAGAIIANYDGQKKHLTVVEHDVFVGCNAVLVAKTPSLVIGSGAVVAAGSVITEDVPPHALAIARGRQVHKPDWTKTKEKSKE